MLKFILSFLALLAFASALPSDLIVKSNPQIQTSLIEKKVGSIECQLCIYVFELVDNQLKNNKTEDEIVQSIESICNLFLSDIKAQCQAFVQEYGLYVVKLAAAKLDPVEACTALRVCNKDADFSRIFLRKLREIN